MPNPTKIIELDVAVIGGGIAGLWLLNRLHTDNYNCALFESTALGSDQSVASQGMIHGGIKYTLSGSLTGASEAIADMPALWRKCLDGNGDVDLRRASILSDHFYMWSSASVTSKVSTFFASKATRGRVDKIKAKDRPEIFQHPDFSGQLYKLVDMVLDVPSVISALANNVNQGDSPKTFLTPASQQQWQITDGQTSLLITTNDQVIEVKAKQFIFTAGKGNGDILKQLNAQQPQMQTRPLQQVMIKHDYPHPFYGHCLGADKTPRLTISSHKATDGKWIWYLGGSLAEKGVAQTADELINCAKKELTSLMPWVDLTNAKWSTLAVDRAEPKQKNLVRPDQAFIGSLNNIANAAVAWPTKLTLAPNLANEVLQLLQDKNISPSSNKEVHSLNTLLPIAPLSDSPWDFM
jgi:glycerol-3-phosphate dehydrogenase